MNNVIYKVALELTGVQKIVVRRGAKILSVQVQDNRICLWALINKNELLDILTIEIHGTGRPINHDPGIHLGTVQMGDMVWHVFQGL